MQGHQVKHFGKYTTDEKLGEGGMAVVYKGHAKNMFGVVKTIAIKVMNPSISKEFKYAEMFKQEARIAVQLNHSNVVSVIDFGALQDQCYVVMDYVDGYNLLQLLKNALDKDQPLRLAEILFIAKEASAGLDYVHRFRDPKTNQNLNIVHCDISPHNIMVSQEGQVKIIDFGVAKSNLNMQKRLHQQEEFGKIRYVSPEQLAGQTATQQTDIYALGITLWELTTGVRIFQGLKPDQIQEKIQNFELPDLRQFRPDCPDEWVDILVRATHRDLKNRYQKINEFNRDVSIILNTNYPSYTNEDFRLRIESLNNKAAEPHSAVEPTAKVEAQPNIKIYEEVPAGQRIETKKRPKFQAIETSKIRTYYLNPIYIVLLLLALGVYWLENSSYMRGRPINSEAFVKKVTTLIKTGQPNPMHDPEREGLGPQQSVKSPAPVEKNIITTVRTAKPKDEAPLGYDERYVRIASVPPGAYIYINGYYAQLKTPANAKVSISNPSSVLIRLSGYKDENLLITKEMSDAQIVMKPLRPTQ